MRWGLTSVVLAALLGGGTASAAKPKPPRLQDYCVTKAERRNNAVQFEGLGRRNAAWRPARFAHLAARSRRRARGRGWPLQLVAVRAAARSPRLSRARI